METIIELTEYVRDKALEYVNETGETIDAFPLSIVDFVIEHISNSCHFPSHFTEKNIVSDLSKGKNSLAMACVDVYANNPEQKQLKNLLEKHQIYLEIKIGKVGNKKAKNIKIPKGYTKEWDKLSNIELAQLILSFSKSRIS